ncbi:MAG TPA: restriction endonuclease subunit S [Saprospiraceae bacterium]|nr:restriction endonuclease subunit S [Saprospiraceae bacterium]
MMKRENCLNHRLDGLKDFTEKKSVTSKQSMQIRDSDNKQGWEIKKLGEVCETGAGGTPLKTHKDYYEGGKIPWLLSGEVSQGEIFEARNFITEKGLENSSAKLFPPNTVLVAMYGATAGQVGILRFEAATNQAVCGILPNDKTIPEYLFYCFLEKKEELVAQAVGGAQPNISQIKIKNTKIPLPPLPEQQRLVSILDECFAAIAKAKGNAEQNLKNAKELFESYLQGVFEKKGDGWEEKKLGEVVNKIMTGPFGSMLHQSDYVEEGIPVVNPQNIVDGKIIPLSKTMINQDTFSRLAKYALILGDIVIARRGEMGRCAVVRQENVNWLCGTGSFVIRVNPKKSDSNFLNVILSSNSVKQQLEKSSIGATMSNLNQTILSELPIRIPPLKAQQTIVRQLDALRAETQKLEAVYQKKIDDLEELKKSILQKAFAGELKTEKAWTI